MGVKFELIKKTHIPDRTCLQIYSAFRSVTVVQMQSYRECSLGHWWQHQLGLAMKDLT